MMTFGSMKVKMKNFLSFKEELWQIIVTHEQISGQFWCIKSQKIK